MSPGSAPPSPTRSNTAARRASHEPGTDLFDLDGFDVYSWIGLLEANDAEFDELPAISAWLEHVNRSTEASPLRGDPGAGTSGNSCALDALRERNGELQQVHDEWVAGGQR